MQPKENCKSILINLADVKKGIYQHWQNCFFETTKNFLGRKSKKKRLLEDSNNDKYFAVATKEHSEKIFLNQKPTQKYLNSTNLLN